MAIPYIELRSRRIVRNSLYLSRGCSEIIVDSLRPPRTMRTDKHGVEGSIWPTLHETCSIITVQLIERTDRCSIEVLEEDPDLSIAFQARYQAEDKPQITGKHYFFHCTASRFQRAVRGLTTLKTFRESRISFGRRGTPSL